MACLRVYFKEYAKDIEEGVIKMSRILVLGAAGQVAQLVIEQLLKENQHELVLYLRHAERLSVLAQNPHVTVIEGDVLDQELLVDSLAGVDIVYANLGGQFEPLMQNVVATMTAAGIKRLIYISGLGLYHEVPGAFGEWNEQAVGHEVMEDTRRAAKIVEQSTLNYTILRCAYMTNEDRIDYELTEKGTPFKGTIISRRSIAQVVVDLINHPAKGIGASWGINQPKTDGDRPIY